MRKIDENEPWCGSIPRIYRHIIKWHNISSLFSVSAPEKQCLRGKRCWGSLSNKDPNSQRPSVVWSFSPRHYWVWCFAILVDLQYSGRLATPHRGWWATFHTYLWWTHWGRDKVADVFQTTFSNADSWMKTSEFRSAFHWSSFLKVQMTNIPAMVQIIAWRRTVNKPLFEPMAT